MNFSNLGDVNNWGHTMLSRGAKCCRLAGLILAAAIVVPAPGNAQSPKDSETPAAQTTETPSTDSSKPSTPEAPAKQSASNEPADLSVELNKLESVDKGCRAYVVVKNSGDTNYQTFKLDLVLFQTDGIIGRRFALDLAPLKPEKRVVKLFDLDGTTCDRIGTLLINDVLECKSDAGSSDNCLARMSVSSRAPNVQLSK